jgi:hypothetical protein
MNKSILASTFAAALLALASSSVAADSVRHHRQGHQGHDVRVVHYAHHHGRHLGHRVRHLPRGAITVSIGRAHYFLYGSRWYQRAGRGYVVVNVPRNVVVKRRHGRHTVVYVTPKRHRAHHRGYRHANRDPHPVQRAVRSSTASADERGDRNGRRRGGRRQG